LETLNKKNNN